MNPTHLISWLKLVVRKAAWAPLVVFGIHVIFSRGFDAYPQIPWLDIPMHFVGGIVICYFLWHAIDLASQSHLLDALSPLAKGLMAWGLSASAAVFWEFAEFTVDALFGTCAQPSLEDTMLDLLLGILGATTFLLLRQWLRR